MSTLIQISSLNQTDFNLKNCEINEIWLTYAIYTMAFAMNHAYIDLTANRSQNSSYHHHRNFKSPTKQ